MQYTRNDWYVGCFEADLAEGVPVSVPILGERIVLWRSGDTLFALEDRCVHRAAALSLGRCEGANLRCMYHGILFAGNGEAVEIPGQDIIPPGAHVRAWPVAVRHGMVWVWMGDAEKVEEGLLPELFPGVDLDDYLTGSGTLDFEAEATLISDNLLDFSHLPFVHGESFQAAPDWVKTTMKVEQLDRGMRFERWMENGRGSFLYDPPPDFPFDEWHCYDYLVPGVLIMWLAIFPQGTARAIDFSRPDFSQAIGQVATNIQAITPTGNRSSRYFFTTGLHRRLGGDPEILHQLRDTLRDVTYKAFLEDKRVIEAQQKVIDRDPGRPLVPTIHDRGVTIYSRLKARLVAAEQSVLAEGQRRAVRPPAASVAAPDPERNKALVSTLFDIIYGASLEHIARIDEFVAEDYVQHNPIVGPGREGLRQLLQRIVSEPEESRELSARGTISVNLIAEGDFVVRQEMRTNGMLVDIFRIRDGRLQEHWDAFRFASDTERIPGF